MTDLAAAVCSVTRTQRGRFLWAAWWTGAPSHAPFRKPDACDGGAATYEEAFAEAERVAGRHLTPIEAYWARAWSRVLRGEAPPPLPRPRGPREAREGESASAWSVLGVAPGASREEVKRAFRARALETHPDQGGDTEAYLRARAAFERLMARRHPSR